MKYLIFNALIIILYLFTDCTNFKTIFVTDEKGKPVEGAVVAITGLNMGKKYKTESNGKVRVSLSETPRWCSITKEGYQPVYTDVTNKSSVKIILKKSTKNFQSGMDE